MEPVLTAATQTNLSTLTPSAVVHLFANSLRVPEASEIHKLKGVYVAGQGVDYQGVYYDRIKDEMVNAVITLVVPGLIRKDITNGQVIEVMGYMIQRMQMQNGRIEISFMVTDLVGKAQAQFSAVDKLTAKILQQKSDQGFRDVDNFIRAKVFKNEPVTIKILIGKNAIIDSDIKDQLKDGAGFYDIEFVRISLGSEHALIDEMQKAKCDILVVARGGGEGMELFNNPAIASSSLYVRPLFVTAIGHSQDTPLLQKVADKSFITPTAFGQYLNDLYNNAIEEKSRSKAGIVQEVTAQLKVLYDKDKENLNTAFTNKENHWLEQRKLLEEQLAHAKQVQPVVEQKTNWGVVIGLVLGGIAIGAVIVYFIFNK